MGIEIKYPGTINILKCVGLRNEESVLILIDDSSDTEAMTVLEKVFNSKCSKVSILTLPQKIQPDFPQDIRQSIKEFDVIMLAASQSWYQAPSRRNAKYRYGKRIFECYNLKLEMLKDGALCADYKEVASFTKGFKNNFKASSTIEMSTNKGTRLKAVIENVFDETGIYDRPGTGGNLPAGEISLGVEENSVEGEVVFDLSFDLIDRLESPPLKVIISKGKVIDVKGKSKNILDNLITQDSRLRNIAELGIGTNEHAVLGRSVLEDEKKLGTTHVGFGNDTYFGGKVEGAHIDGVISNATITVDENPVLLDGVLVRG